jgi:hypothetical protein
MLLLPIGSSYLNNAPLNCNIKAELSIVFEADMINLIHVIFYPSAETGRLTDRRITMNTVLWSDMNH